jgi:hyperosmotically inducible protein
MRTILFVLCLALSPAFAQAPAGAGGPLSARAQDRISREVRHELLMMPNYTLFDIVGYQVQGSTVILSGKVRNSVVKGEAENGVRHIEGVEKVVNNIEVLPPSPFDDGLRRRVARALADHAGLGPYFVQAVPSIHIIVQSGHVTLEGVVDSQGDKSAAEIVTKGIPGIFSVTNNLLVESSRKK